MTITKADPAIPAGLTATYGDVLSSVTLPDGWLWEGTGTVGNAGTQIHLAKFTPTDLANYNVMTGTIIINIAKAPAPAITWPTASSVNGGQTLAASVLSFTSNDYGTFAWTNPAIVTTHNNSGYELTFTPSAHTLANYEAITPLTKILAVTVTYAVTVFSDGTNTSGGGNYTVGAVVSVNAGTAPAGQRFVRWESSPAGIFVNASSATGMFIMPAGPVIVMAVFENDLTSVASYGNSAVPSGNSSTDAAVVAPASQLSAEFTAGPNPVAKSAGIVNFFRQGKRVDDATLAIYDASGNFIRKIAIADKVIGGQTRRQVGSWDLKDANGRVVGEGAYVVKGVLRMADGKAERVSVILGVR